MRPKLSSSIATLVLLAASSAVLAQVEPSALERRDDGLWYLKEGEAPYSGTVVDPGQLEGRVDAGKRVGEWVWTYPSGIRQYVIAYNDDGSRAAAKGWHENGKVRSEATFKDDRPDGVNRTWDEHGVLRHERPYAQGQPASTERVWDHNGDLLYSAEYADGELNGAATWWYPNGEKRWETHYASGVRSGTWVQLAEDGSLQMETAWENGKLVSRHNPHEGH